MADEHDKRTVASSVSVGGHLMSRAPVPGPRSFRAERQLARELPLPMPVTILSARLAVMDRSDGCVDIIDLLLIDHARQRCMLKSILNTALDDRARLDLFEELRAELMAHAAAEEQTFYAELLAHARELIQLSVSANDRVAELAFRLRDLEVGSPQWLAVFAVLNAEIESHLDLEEAQLLPLARRLLRRSRAKRLGKRFEQVKLRELCLDGGCPVERQTAAAPGPSATSVLVDKRQQLRRMSSSQAGGRGLRRRAVSRRLPREKGG